MDKVDEPSRQNRGLEQNGKDTGGFETNCAAELNSLTSRQIKSPEVPQNQIKTGDKNLSTLSLANLANGCEKIDNPIESHITRARSYMLMDQLQQREDTVYINEVSDVMDVDDNYNNGSDFDSANNINNTCMHKDTESNISKIEDQ